MCIRIMDDLDTKTYIHPLFRSTNLWSVPGQIQGQVSALVFAFQSLYGYQHSRSTQCALLSLLLVVCAFVTRLLMLSWFSSTSSLVCLVKCMCCIAGYHPFRQSVPAHGTRRGMKLRNQIPSSAQASVMLACLPDVSLSGQNYCLSE